MAAGSYRAVVSCVERFDRVCWAERFPCFDVVVQEGDELFPRVAPLACHCAVLFTPHFLSSSSSAMVAASGVGVVCMDLRSFRGVSRCLRGTR